jgi:hypothetical protein
MLRRVIYTLYIVSKERKNEDDFLMSGGSVFFLLFINFITILTIIFWLMKKPFGAFFVEYDHIFLSITIISFLGSQVYARYVIRNIEKQNITIKKLQPVSICLWANVIDMPHIINDSALK